MCKNLRKNILTGIKEDTIIRVYKKEVKKERKNYLNKKG